MLSCDARAVHVRAADGKEKSAMQASGPTEHMTADENTMQ
jgi:hypothetical protein